MPTEVTTPGSSVTTDGTTQTLFSTTLPGVYVLSIDCINNAGGDTVVLAALAKVRASGSALNVFAPVSVSGAQVEPNIIRRTMAVVAPQGCSFTIQRTAGSARAYPYRVDRIASCTVTAEGSLTFTGGTEQSLAVSAVNGVFVMLSDHTNQAAADTVVARLKTAVVTAGTRRVVEMVTLVDAQTDASGNRRQQSVAEPSDYSTEISLQKTAGANHAVPWALCQVGA